MITRIILLGCIASCVLLSAKCNNEVKKGSEEKEAKGTNTVQPENIVHANDSPPSLDPSLPKMSDDTVKVYHDYIKDHIDSLTRLIEQNPEEPEYYLRRGDLLIGKGDNARGCEDYLKAKSLGAKNMQSLLDKNCK